MQKIILFFKGNGSCFSARSLINLLNVILRISICGNMQIERILQGIFNSKVEKIKFSLLKFLTELHTRVFYKYESWPVQMSFLFKTQY